MLFSSRSVFGIYREFFDIPCDIFFLDVYYKKVEQNKVAKNKLEKIKF